MRILFMGTPDIAAVSLKALCDRGCEVVGAVTQPDKPRGRGHKTVPTEVKVCAAEYGIPVFQPESLKGGELQPILDELHPDLILVVAYGKILPPYVLDYPKYGCINMHASLLPKYRGAAPIQWSVINGDEITGVTTMKMDRGMDTGDMLLSRKIQIGQYETSEELFERIALLGAEVLCETVERLGELRAVPQNEAEATYAPMITKEMGRIDWNKDAEAVSKHICGMYSWPVAYTTYKGEIMKVIAAKISKEEQPGECGEILAYEKGRGLKVKCRSGAVYLEVIQFAGTKKMKTDDYMLGHSLDIGAILGGSDEEE